MGDTGDNVTVWWRLIRGQVEGRQNLLPGERSEPNVMPYGIRHHVCVEYKPPEEAIFLTSCKWETSGEDFEIMETKLTKRLHENTKQAEEEAKPEFEAKIDRLAEKLTRNL